MRYIITGGTGFIGQQLIQNLPSDSDIIVLTRKGNSQENNVRYIKWDGKTGNEWFEFISEDSFIINLAGQNISKGRWSRKNKKRILSSRIDSGKACIDAIRKADVKPQGFFQASAVGYYGWKLHEILYEGDRATGADFLSQVCIEWEDSTIEIEEMGIRRIVGRIGVVFHPNNGAFPLMVLPIKLFMGGPVGTGKQWVSWIHYKDLVRSIIFLVNNVNAQGIFNLSAPGSVTNRKLTKEIATRLKRPFWIRTPSFVLKLLLGQKADIVLSGQRVFPQRLLDLGFEFDFPFLDQYLDDLLQKKTI